MMSGLLHVASALTFTEIRPEPLSVADERARAAHWEQASLANPALFDGRLLLATGAASVDGAFEVSYFESSFSHYLWSRAAGNRSYAGALYASVMGVSADGHLIAGRMGDATSTPQRVQLPGGNVERADGAAVTLDTARAVAGRELAEETGLGLAFDELRLTHVKTGGAGNDVGIFFSVALPWTLAEIANAFAAHVAALSGTGDLVEFSELVAFGRGHRVDPHEPEYAVDYMEDAIRVALAFEGRPLRHERPRHYRPGVVAVKIEAA